MQGVFKARALQPDIILLDVNLPHMNGLEAAARSATPRHSRRSSLSAGTTDPQVIQGAIDAGGLGYVMKPRAGRDLIPAIRRALQAEQG